MLRPIILHLCLACCAAPAVAKDIFVDNAQGVDRNNGATALPQGAGNGPVRSIARALLLAEKADRIILANTGVSYQESVTLQAGWHSGFDRSFPFRVVGNGAVLDGTAPVPPETWETFLGPVFRFQPPRMAHQTLLLADQPLVRKPLVGGHLPALQPLEWCLYDGYVYFRSENERLPQQYPLRYGGLQTGVTLYDIHFVEISDLVVRGYQLDGVNVHDNCCGITLTNVTSERNGRSGFSISGWCKTTLDQCAATDNGVAQVRVDELAKVTLIGGAYANNGVPALLQLGGRITRKEPPPTPIPPMAE